MALNDKLINYEDISAFHSNLLNDSSVSDKATWSSSKINSSLGEIDEKIESVKPIEEVSELPEASENKDKFYRLDNGEKDVYAAKLLSSETITTNRLPDAQQIDKAYLFFALEDTGTYYGEVAYYKSLCTIITPTAEYSGYLWYRISDGGATIYGIVSVDSAENVTVNTNCYIFTNEDGDEFDLQNNIIYSDYFDGEFNMTISDEYIPVPATYNAPEANQIGNANLDDEGEELNWIYDGTPVTITIDDEQFTGYKWLSADAPDDYILTDKQASNIYFYEDNDNGTTYCDVKCYRVSNGDAASENILYIDIPQLNAPDSEQVDNAYLEMETHNKGNGKFYYKGEIQIREYDYETVSSDYVIGHLWETEDKYHQYVTLTNAQNVYGVNIGGHFADEDLQDYGDGIGWASTTYTLSEIPGLISYYDTEWIYSQVPSTVKYQRTETIEEWGWEKVASEQYVDDAIAEIPQLEAGQNIEIADNKINAKGYFYDDEPKEELKSIDNIIQSIAGQPLNLKISGAAGATTYTYTDDFGGAFEEIIQAGYLPGVGSTYQTANGKSGVIASVNASTITFEETLDADNALTNESVLYVVELKILNSFSEGIYDYVDGDVRVFEFLLSGAAGSTTYTYSNNNLGIIPIGSIITLQNGKSAKLVSVDDTNNTGTFETTFDADNAINNELVVNVSNKNNASGKYSHTEGGVIRQGIVAGNTASGEGSHAEGAGTLASGWLSHAEGWSTTATGDYAHSEGYYTIVNNNSEHAEGKFNISHTSSNKAGNTQLSIGMGTDNDHRKNAFEVMQNGDIYVYGVGDYQGTDITVQNTSIKTLQAYIASLEARIAALEGNTTVS